MGVGDILKEGAEVYESKEKDYGRSWRLVGETFSLWSDGRPVTLETPEDFVRFGLFTRRLDKLIRAYNAEFHSNQLSFEGVFDSHRDESVYAAMHASTYEEEDEGM